MTKLPYYTAPENDGQRLLNLQHDFKSGDAAALGKMYDLLVTIGYKTINKLCEGNDVLKALSAAERKQKAHDAATYIIEQYLKKPAFVILDSFSGYLFRRIQKELFYVREFDKLVFYTDTLPDVTQETKNYEYVVTNCRTGFKKVYSRAEQILLNPTFRRMRKKQLAECIKTGATYKTYTFEIREV